jgi:hypothetical protein
MYLCVWRPIFRTITVTAGQSKDDSLLPNYTFVHVLVTRPVTMIKDLNTFGLPVKRTEDFETTLLVTAI